MKITIISDIYGFADNGTAIAAKNLAVNMQKRGHEITIVSPFVPDKEDKSGFKYITVDTRSFCGLEWYVKKNGVVMGKPELEKILKGIVEADVVHLLMPFKMSRAALPLLRMLNIPYTSAVHCQAENVSSHFGLKDFKLFNDFIYMRFWNKFYRHVDFVHTPSKFIASELKKRKYTNNFYVITNGVNPKFKRIEGKRPQALSDKFVILTTGRYSTEKRKEVLLKAIKYSKYKDRIQVVCLGQGPRENYLKKVGKNLPNQPIFGYAQFDEFLNYLNFADLYVHPSDIEIEGISCLEAMTCGRPCIFSDSPRSAAKDFARNENSLFKAGDAKDLAKKIDYFIEHDEERRKLGEYYADYAKAFSMDNAMDKMEQMFKDAIEYYSDYYRKHPDGGVHGDFSPSASDHVVHSGNSVVREKVDEHFQFEHKNIFYRMYSRVLLFLGKLFIPPFVRFKYGYKIISRKTFRKMRHKGGVIVSNHVHYMDGALICAKMVGWRKTRFIILNETLAVPVAGKILLAMGGHPTADNVIGARNSFRVLNKTLQDNKLILMFPEASLHPYSTELRSFNDGAFRIAVNNKKPIIPVVITFKQKQTKKKLKSKMCLTALQPIYPNEDFDKKAAVEDLIKRTSESFIKTMDEFYIKYPLIKHITYTEEEAKAAEEREAEIAGFIKTKKVKKSKK